MKLSTESSLGRLLGSSGSCRVCLELDHKNCDCFIPLCSLFWPHSQSSFWQKAFGDTLLSLSLPQEQCDPLILGCSWGMIQFLTLILGYSIIRDRTFLKSRRTFWHAPYCWLWQLVTLSNGVSALGPVILKTWWPILVSYCKNVIGIFAIWSMVL